MAFLRALPLALASAAARAPVPAVFAALTVAVLVPNESAARAQGTGLVHPVAPPVARAEPRQTPVAIDGRLDDAAWQAAAPITQFTQSDPREGEPATQRTEVRFLYDADAIYVGARMYDSLGAAGVRTRLYRRDQGIDANGNELTDADYLFVAFDTFHDHLGRTFFEVNPSGVKYDALGQGVAFPDASWDPVWDAATRIDSLGWTAEFRVPLSQLRFPRDSVQTWGLQVNRFVSRLNETDHFAFWTKREVGGPPRYAHLEGLRFGAHARRLEVMPYAVARSSYVAPSAGDPLNRASATSSRFGGDLKYLLTSNLTLDATINPDFGQVEVDPAVVNLSAFETFYPERRPFFIEGAGIFGFGGFNCHFCDNVSSLDAFYSRRIGRAPHLNDYVSSNYKYVNAPENSTIMGAAKITGRTSNGYSIAVLDGLTRAERATVVTDEGARVRQEVEPLSNYFVGRAKREFRGGNVVVGAIATSVARNLSDSLLATRLSRHAEAVGADWDVSWKQRGYNFMGSALVSNVSGDPAAMLRIQESSTHYFQRPDRHQGSNGLFSSRLDSSATSLRGYGFYSRIAKEDGNWQWEAMLNGRSPGFETNDLSFLTQSGYVWHNANLQRFFFTPTRYYRQLSFVVGGQQQVNYDGDYSNRDVHGYVGYTLPNFWDLSTFYIYAPPVYDEYLTRGGPVVKNTGSHFAALRLSTDRRKPIVFADTVKIARPVGGGPGDMLYVASGITVKPKSNISLTITPSYQRDHGSTQYVTTIDSSAAPGFNGKRYVFSDIAQTTVSMNTRLNVTFTPTLSLELFAQPFLASGDYSAFKEFVAPRTLSRRAYAPGSEIAALQDASGVDTLYVVHPADAPTRPFSFSNPDFNQRSLRGNAVVRWEYRPGSTLFLVWTQQRFDQVPNGDFEFARDRAALFGTHPDNVFLVKLSYWLGL